MSSLEETVAGLKYDSAGLIPAVIVDEAGGDVLMVAYMNEQSLLATIRTKKTHFWSRSRQKYWMKGESSGNTQEVKAIHVDCDLDCLVIRVAPVGPACHEGYRTCFFRQLKDDGELETQGQRQFDPDQVYGKGSKKE